MRALEQQNQAQKARGDMADRERAELLGRTVSSWRWPMSGARTSDGNMAAAVALGNQCGGAAGVFDPPWACAATSSPSQIALGDNTYPGWDRLQPIELNKLIATQPGQAPGTAYDEQPVPPFHVCPPAPQTPGLGPGASCSPTKTASSSPTCSPTRTPAHHTRVKHTFVEVLEPDREPTPFFGSLQRTLSVEVLVSEEGAADFDQFSFHSADFFGDDV